MKSSKHRLLFVDVYFDVLNWSVIHCRHFADTDHRAHATNDPSDNTELTIQKRQLPQRDVELGSDSVLD